MKFYLSNALGFLIQLTPCAVMLFLPFPKLSWRVPRARFFAIMGVGIFALSALFPLILELARGADAAGSFVMLLAAAALFWLCVGVIGVTLLKKLLVLSVILSYAASQFWLVNSARLALPEKYFTGYYVSYAPATTVLYAVTAAVLVPVMLKFVIGPLGDFIRETEQIETQRGLVTAAVSTAVFLAVMMTVSMTHFSKSSFPTVNIVELALIFDQTLIYWLLFRESFRRRWDVERRRAEEIQKLQYDKISQEMESTRRLRHDLRHHMNAIAALNAQGRRAEIAEYLKDYGAQIDRLGRHRYCDDPAADGVLDFYLTQAEERSVDVECEAYLGLDCGVDATDMTVLLGNLLENSLRALEKVPEGRRKLVIELRTAKAMILLRIQNTCADSGGGGEPSDWRAFADRDGGVRGVGLHSVDAIAEKYNGRALFQQKDGMFTTRVILSPKVGRDQ